MSELLKSLKKNELLDLVKIFNKINFINNASNLNKNEIIKELMLGNDILKKALKIFLKQEDKIDDDDFSYLGITDKEADEITYGKPKVKKEKAEVKPKKEKAVVKPKKEKAVVKPKVKAEKVKPKKEKAVVKPEVKVDMSDDEKELELLNKKQINLEEKLSSIKPNRYKKEVGIMIQSTQKALLEVKLTIFELNEKMKGENEKKNNDKDKGKMKAFEKLVKKFIKTPSKKLLDEIDNEYELIENLDEELQEEIEFQIEKFEKKQKKDKKKKK